MLPKPATTTEFQSPRRTGDKLHVPSAPEAAAQAIRDAIITGELKAGERLVEQKWAARFGIGQPTLREALKELEHQGFLRKVPQKGTYVAEVHEQDYNRILEVRLPLEAMAIYRAAQNMTPAAEEELSSRVLEMAQASEKSDIVGFHDSDVAFHRKIWDLADNEYLRISLEAVCFRLFVFSVVGRERNWFRASVQQHYGILEGLCSGDPGRARDSFVEQTIRYWNSHYGLKLSEPEPSPLAPQR